ncbi:MAG TPA: hypothetical protein PKD12_10645 [Nitrospira sp.]|nr:hypothetical protein [Nitrospira sp.]
MAVVAAPASLGTGIATNAIAISTHAMAGQRNVPALLLPLVIAISPPFPLIRWLIPCTRIDTTDFR